MPHDDARQEIDYAGLKRRLDDSRALGFDEDFSPEKRREVLAARAKMLAKSREEERPSVLTVLTFHVGGERYAVPIEQVDHVMESRGLCSLPGAPRHVLGAIFSRSRVVPVLDLRQMLGLEGGGMSDLGKVVVVDVGGEAFGVAAEQVDGRQELLRTTLSQPPPGPFLFLTPDRLTVLDVEKLGSPATARRG
ncbi:MULTISPECIES: chemotaxis protein CheW [Stigmatella]|uniref:Purine-binding chemotaxis protein CheW n=2 Tax=Stigmatella TaxID=40 RepID=A0A1H7UQB0_STIAU|nr:MULTISPECIES: chemotaxis protein CheW [Stigmatella]SEL98808.1 purine-binding chemotaxis protein CheW [Stigmatella aurantiaca]SET49943.1 purine-binding chemotaxis protein CheW [Stigmatella erecta]